MTVLQNAGQSWDQAIREILRDVGLPLFVTTGVLVVGFSAKMPMHAGRELG